MRIQTVTYGSGRWDTRIARELDSTQTLVVTFASRSFAEHQEPFAELRAALPHARMVGCSTSGEIFGTRVSDDSLVAAIVRLEHSRVEVARTRLERADRESPSFAAGRRLAARLAAPDLRAIMVLSDGLEVNGSELVRGINSAVPKDTIVTGGLAGDGPRFQQTWVLDDAGHPASGAVTALGIYGDRMIVGHGSKGGWDAFGPERVVTRSAGNVLYELDGKPALQLYKSYLGDRASGLPGTALLFPLALRRGKVERRIVRTVLSVDEQEQSMTFAGDIEEGSLAQLMRANFDRLVQGASDAATMTGSRGPVLSIAISCVGRRLVLGERVEEETEAALEGLPPGSQQIGYYSYGEISPFVAGGPCDLHNQTMTLTTLAELA